MKTELEKAISIADFLLSNPKYRFNTIDSIRSVVMQQSEAFQHEFAETLYTKQRLSKHFHQLTADDWFNAFVETVEEMK